MNGARRSSSGGSVARPATETATSVTAASPETAASAATASSTWTRLSLLDLKFEDRYPVQRNAHYQGSDCYRNK